MDTLTLTRESSNSDDVHVLLQHHFDLMRATSPAESCHVMEPEQLSDTEIVMMGVRRGGQLLGIGALKTLNPVHAELKSMHTAQSARGQGVARLLLDGLIEQAKDASITRISLETGTADEFQAARRLYQQSGFENCAPFGNYVLDPLSIFMTRQI